MQELEVTTEVQQRGAPPTQAPWRVLVIDDERAVHQTYQAILEDEQALHLANAVDALAQTGSSTIERPSIGESLNFLLDSAMGGEEGYQKVIQAQEQNTPYAVILLDMRMPPGWDGLKTAEMIRTVDSEARIVLITAFMDYDLEEVRRRIGLNFDFLKKPVDHSELIQMTYSSASSWSEHRALIAARQMLESVQGDLEQQVEARTHELNASQAESQQIIESMNEGLVVLDQNGLIERVNPKLQQMCGKRPEDLIGKPIHTLFTDASLPLLHGQRFMYGAEDAIIPVDISGALLHQSGEDAADQGAVLVVHDLTDHLRAEAAHRSSQAKDEFIASVSHELRTPLTAIIGNSEMLSEAIEQQLDPEQSKMLRSIEISGRTQLALVNDILDLSKIEAGKFEVDESAFDLRTLLDEIHHIFSVKAEDVSVEFLIEQPEMSRQLLGDGRRIAQVLTNLLSNAMKFTAQGTVRLQVWVDEMASHIHFRVSDSGIGISEDVLNRLFQPYEQADRSISSRFGGTGLGLHISNTLAELMGGEIRVESEEGEGSQFELVLPFLLSDLPVLVREAEDEQQVYYFSGRVLVAEDTPELQMLECRLLKSSGVEVTLVNNGKEAVSMALAQPFDLILMDMQMPEMDGIEATETLRKVGVETPIVALTANAMQQHRERFEAAGCNGFLSKPIDRSELRGVLLSYLSECSGAERSSCDNPLVDENFVTDELMALFVERTATLKQQMAEAFAVQQWSEVRVVAHTVKGTGATFGYPELTRLGQALMQCIDQNLISDATKHVEQLLQAMGQVTESSGVVVESG